MSLGKDRDATFTISAFGDEIDVDLDRQLEVLNDLDIRYLELRNAWGTNVQKLDDDQVSAISKACIRHSVKVSCIGSPIGKSSILDPVETEIKNLRRIFEIANVLKTDKVRIFSFYPPNPKDRQSGEKYINEAVSRLSKMAREADEYGISLLLENEDGLVGDNAERCLVLLKETASPALRFVWDTANFVVAGFEKPTDRGWADLSPYLEYVQIKDYRVSDKTICPPGEGDSQIPELLNKLRKNGYQGFLALEPHLVSGGSRGGFSGPEGMRRAAKALRNLMAEAGCVETKTNPS